MGRRLAYSAVALATVALAVDYSLLMPTLWPYLLSMDPDTHEYFYGICLASFGLSSFVASFFVVRVMTPEPRVSGTDQRGRAGGLTRAPTA